MMSKGLFWGILLITLGIVFLGQNFEWFSIDWSLFFRFWPLLVILAGVNLILARRHSIAAVITTILLAVATPLAIISVFHSNDRYGYRDRDNDNEKDGLDQSEEKGIETKVRSNHIAAPMDAGIQEARLKFESGAGRFFISSPADSLIEADTRMTVSNYSMSLNRNDRSHEMDIELKLDDRDINLRSGELVNRVDLRLNPVPIWSFDFGIGAGLAEFDLSPYLVKAVKLSAGAADIDLRLGDRAVLSEVSVESGVASVTLAVPKAIGCQIEYKGALNVKKLDGFGEIEEGIYQTADYGTASKKIKIKFEGGMSRFRVTRY